MTFHIKNRQKRFSYLVAIIALLIVLLAWIRPSFLGGFTHQIGRPIWASARGVRALTRTITIGFSAKEKLAAENLRLKRELQGVETIIIRSESLERENEALRALTGKKPANTFLFARTLTKVGFSPYDTFVLNVGERDGLMKKGGLYTLEGLLVGYVDQVYDHTSVARLYSSPGEEFRVLVGTEELPGTAIGRGGGNFELKLPRDLKVKKGDHIMAEDDKHGVAGVVEDIELDVTNSLQTILFRQPVNIYTITEVLVEKNIN